MNRKSRQLYLYELILLASACIWGSGFIATQVAVDAQYSPAFILLVRYVISTVILRLLFHKRFAALKQQRQGLGSAPVERRAALICGTSFFAGFLLQTYGLQGTTPSMNAFLTATSVIFVPFLIWLFFRKRPYSIVFLASLICFTGIFILSLKGSGRFELQFGLGEILTLLSAISFAIHTVFLGYYASRLDPLRLTYLQILVSAIGSLIYFLLFDRDWSQFLYRPGMWSLAYLTLFTTILAFLLQTLGLSHVPADKGILIICTESLFASAFSLAFGFDSWRWQLIVGGLLIFGSIVLTEVVGQAKAKKALKATPSAAETPVPLEGL